MSKKSFIAGLAIGAVIGSVAAWHFVKKKYEQLVQEEVESVKEAFERYYTEVDKNILDSEPGECEPVTQVDKEEYKQIVGGNDYVKCDLTNDCSDPYVIAPEELGGEQGEYNILSLTYYSDGVLADDSGEVYNVGVVGEDSLEHFGDYEDEAVHVRNESWNTDFEIFLDERKYTEVF